MSLCPQCKAMAEPADVGSAECFCHAEGFIVAQIPRIPQILIRRRIMAYAAKSDLHSFSSEKQICAICEICDLKKYLFRVTYKNSERSNNNS